MTGLIYDALPPGEPARQWKIRRHAFDVDRRDLVELEWIRRELRAPEWDDLPPELLEDRGLLLDRVCRRLVEAFPDRASYYAGVGDLLAATPDTIEGLGVPPADGVR